MRVQAIQNWGQIGASAVPALLTALKKDDRDAEFSDFENPDLRKAIIHLGEPAFEALIKALQPDSDLGGAAAKTLALWGDVRAVEPLIQAMSDQQVDLNDRLYAMDALGTLGDLRAIQPLKAAFGDENDWVR